MSNVSFVLTLAARPESAPLVRHVLGGAIEVWPVSDALLHDIQIAVTEACTNVIRHAYPKNGDGLLEVEGDVDDGRVVIAVRDNGEGMAPHPASEGLGLGLPLMGALTERLSFHRTPEGAHEVRMTFPPEPG